MTFAQYRTARAALAAGLGALVAASVVMENFPLAAAAVSVAIIIALFLRSRVKEIIADERDYQSGGTAARYTLSVVAVVGAIASFTLLTLRSSNPLFEPIGSVISYSVCGMLLLYSFLFTYLNREYEGRRKLLYMSVAAILVLVFVVAGLRIFSGEDAWRCENGQWIEHGHPGAPMPAAPCH